MKRAPGLFISGTDTEVGKTYVAALIARELAASGRRVGVYKPAASGCWYRDGMLVSGDALVLWEAAGRPGESERVCPQRFEVPLAPHLAAREQGRELDPQLLRTGVDYWHARSDVVLVEGAGGLMSPLGETEYVADLAADLGFPLIVVARNALGTINHTLQTLIAAAAHVPPLRVAGIVLNRPAPPPHDPSMASNRQELCARCQVPLLAEVGWQAERFDTSVDWLALAR
jgi:dethiobiotin synthetase